MRTTARYGAYLITLLLAAVWAADAADTLSRPLFDIGRPRVGELILSVSGALSLSPKTMVSVAQLLAGLKLMVGLFLLVAIVHATRAKMRREPCDDSFLDVALFVAAVASIASAMPGLMYGGELLLNVIGELMLCVIASLLAVFGRGFLVPDERPAPVRPEPLIIRS